MNESAPIMTETETPEVSLASLELELASWRDRHLRLQAEHDNFRKRKNKEVDDNRRHALQGIMESFLPIIDHFELALAAEHDRTAPDWGAGIELIFRQVIELLRGQGLVVLAPAAGEAFEPGPHEAIALEPNPAVAGGRVSRLTRKGYRLRERLLRPAQVVVAAESAPALERADV